MTRKRVYEGTTGGQEVIRARQRSLIDAKCQGERVRGIARRGCRDPVSPQILSIAMSFGVT